ncbi:MAG TPA: pyridoxal-phosphate dependent enzyme [Gemmatimonadaceae bacterium]|nr:pyridoxal-phosphate dependent enzyme [Gemmatimonadaceae bacterium]
MAERPGRGEGRGARDERAATDASPLVPRPSPLYSRFPLLAAIPRARLGEFPTPVERLPFPEPLWVKRDDLSAAELGGNKVRALEFLLGGLLPGSEVLTLGGEGSTHILCTAVHAARLGIRTRAVRWRHDMNPAAVAVRDRARPLCAELRTSGGALRGMAAAQLARIGAHGRSLRYIPIGGTSPLGTLGHVNAGLELAEQVAAGLLPEPARVVLPLGSGGTAAGLALAFRIAGLRSIVVGVRVAPRIGSNRARVLRASRAAAALIARHTGARPPLPTARDVVVVHGWYGGAYGRALPEAAEAAATLRRLTGLRLDDTYSAKAFAAALALARRDSAPTLFWLTFDGRWMKDNE